MNAVIIVHPLKEIIMRNGSFLGSSFYQGKTSCVCVRDLFSYIKGLFVRINVMVPM
jgi:hypothetical protein